MKEFVKLIESNHSFAASGDIVWEGRRVLNIGFQGASHLNASSSQNVNIYNFRERPEE